MPDSKPPASFTARTLSRIGRRLHPLFAPDHERQTDRLAKLTTQLRAIESDLADQRAAVADVKTSIADVKATLDNDIARGRDVVAASQRKMRDSLAVVHDKLRQQNRLAARVLHVTKHAGMLHGTEAWVRARLETLARSGGAILVGPWTGEVGFELLYWAPFVRWAASEYQLDPERLIVLSRGGTSAWYGDLARQYVDAFDLVDVASFRSASTQKLKQRRISAFDRLLLRQAGARLGRRVRVLHPSLMYEMFLPVWKGQASLDRVFSFTRHARVTALEPDVQLRLPSSYVAVRFYFSGCFPDTPENRELIRRTLLSLTRQHDVVLLDPGIRVDDHYDYAATTGHRIHRLGAEVSPACNLAVQTAVLAGSHGYVGTYGGYAYLAPLLGRDAVAFFSVPNFYVHHLELAQRAFEQAGAGHLTTIDAGAAELARSALSR